MCFIGAHGGHKMILVLLKLKLHMVVRMLWIRKIRDSGSTAVSDLIWANSPVSKSVLKKLPIYLCKLLSVYIVTYHKWKFLLFHVTVAICRITLYCNSSPLISCPRNFKSDPDRSLISVWNLIFRFHPVASLQKCTVITVNYIEQWCISFLKRRMVQVLFKVCLKVKLRIRKKNEPNLASFSVKITS